MSKVAVIGSGPSGWTATQKLAELAIRVDIFSSNVELDEISRINFPPESNPINRKLLNGSDYPYQLFPKGPAITQSKVDVTTSFARAGLSLVWGATMLPYSKIDIQDWCVPKSDLEKGYEWVTARVPIAGRIDSLAKDFRPYLSYPPLLPSSRILKLLERSRDCSDDTFTIGSSRLAVYSVKKEREGCIYCSKCLAGCPIDVIWKAPEVNAVKQNYFTDLRVISIHKFAEKYQLKTIGKDGKEIIYGGYDRVFLGAGPVESFRILAASGIVEPQTTLLDSQTFFVPILLSSKYRSLEVETYTLSQVFCHLKEGFRTKSQLQIYDYSDDLIPKVKTIVPLINFLPTLFIKKLLQRLFIGIGYLNDKDSTKIHMEIDENGNVFLEPLDVEKPAKKNVKFIVRAFRRKLSPFGLFPLYSLTKVALPGQGVHYGGWLPMGGGSDSLGQPSGFTGIHVIDSSILPSIPAGPITFTIMANAVRIVEEIYT
jgi:hypothetical protein